MIELPVINDCQGCSACCMEQESPPGYLTLLLFPEWHDQHRFHDDVNRVRALPDELKGELLDYGNRLLAMKESGQRRTDFACIWLDRENNRCKHYELRPQICRDFQRGSDGCRRWRQAYHPNGPNELTEEQFVKQHYPAAGVSRRKAGGRLRFEIVHKPVYGRPKKLSKLVASEEAAWASAAKRLQPEKKT